MNSAEFYPPSHWSYTAQYDSRFSSVAITSKATQCDVGFKLLHEDSNEKKNKFSHVLRLFTPKAP